MELPAGDFPAQDAIDRMCQRPAGRPLGSVDIINASPRPDGTSQSSAGSVAENILGQMRRNVIVNIVAHLAAAEKFPYFVEEKRTGSVFSRPDLNS